MKEVHIVVTGRVQNVGFRYWTRRLARKLNISGTVQNHVDGSVMIIAQGDENALKILVESTSEGPPLSDVSNMKVDWLEPTQKFEGFEILR